MSLSNKEKLVEIYTGKIPSIDSINSIGFHTTRLKAISPTRSFVAIDTNLYDINIQYPSNPKIEKGRQGPFISRPIKLQNVQIANKKNPILSMKHPIQNINIINKSNDNLIISCIDNRGIIKVKNINEGTENEQIVMEPPAKKRKLDHDTIASTNTESSISEYSVSMKCENAMNYFFSFNNNKNNNDTNNKLYSSGYCSLDRDLMDNDKFISISSSHKLLNVGKRDKVISSIYLSQTPRTCKYYSLPSDGNNKSSSSVILINEGKVLSVWDERDINKCIKRIDLRSDMYSMDINNKSTIKYIGCCGRDKIVYVIDPFKWNIHSMWKSCAKYELLQCRFSNFNDCNGKYVYCVGMDHDLICGQWETTNFVDRKLKNKDNRNKNNSNNRNNQQNKNKNKKKQKKKQQKKMDIDGKGQTKQNRDTTTVDLRFSHCFRSDSKWIGVDYVNHAGFQSMIGITNTATIYVAHKPHLLNPSTHCK